MPFPIRSSSTGPATIGYGWSVICHSQSLTARWGGRAKESPRQLDESLERLETDCIDLVQHHEILRYDDPHRIFDEEGANRALVDGQRAGKIRYIGFTGHKDPHVHLYMLDVARQHDFLFDTVQMPLNVMDAHYRSFGKHVLPELVRQGIGVLGMKPMANGIILKSKTVSPMECEAASTFRPLSDPELTALLSKTAKAAASGEFEPFKTSSIFDGTAKNPAWLGDEPHRLRDLMP
jgi:aryl-alcohol dehydrogenase-like predicted oxidoreductase